MTIWQADFYKSSSPNPVSGVIWELLICDHFGNIIHENHCLQSEANSDWLTGQLYQASQLSPPEIIQVFRPQCANLFLLAGQNLNLKIELTRQVNSLKKQLESRQIPINIDSPPPQPIPDQFLGQEWRFARFPAGDLINFFGDRSMPIRSLPEAFFPLKLGLASTVMIPGLVITGGKKSLVIARWLEEIKPVFINHIPTETARSGGLVLESGLNERWIFLTYEDEEVAQAANAYETSKQESQGLHFLLIQPDDSGRTFTGFWLLKEV
jgi:RNA-binding protein Tab2/Atab2